MNDEFQRVSVIGLGYIGLPTAAAFASRKVKVIGVDVNQRVIDTINEGKVHIVEPELDIVVHAVVTSGCLHATTTPEPADAFLIAVPTPFRGDHEPDLTWVEAATRSIAPVLRRGNLVILESTSPVGSTEQMCAWLSAERPDLTFPTQAGEDADILVAHCPERVLPGHVLRELVQNDRVIGGLNRRSSEAAVRLYQIFVEGECIVTDARTAEMCKLTENSFRDVNIAFANELSMICDRLGMNVWELIRLANRHPRVNILQPGPGVGGHCIAVDPWFIVHQTPEEAQLIRQARGVNEQKPLWVMERVRSAVGLIAKGGKAAGSIKIALLGVAFKPNIDDLRESPALRIAEALSTEFPGQCVVVEPNVTELPPRASKLPLLSVEDALAQADVVVALVAHKEFAELGTLLLARQILVDVVGICSNR